MAAQTAPAAGAQPAPEPSTSPVTSAARAAWASTVPVSTAPRDLSRLSSTASARRTRFSESSIDFIRPRDTASKAASASEK